MVGMSAADPMNPSRELLDGLGIVIWELDARELNVVAISDRIEQLSGHVTSRWLDSSARFLDFVHEDDRARVLSALTGAVEHSASDPLDFRILTADSRVRWVRSSCHVMAGAQSPHVVGTMLDVTDCHELKQAEAALAEQQRVHESTFDEVILERKHLEQQVRQAHKMEAIGRLAGGIAHDFNNLLTAIVGYADLALRQLDEPGPSTIRGDLQEICAAGKSAAALTRQLLAFSRQQVLQPQIMDLNAVIEGMQGLLRRLIDEQIDIRWQPAQPLDRINADPSQIEQVVLNLALNARDAMPEGGTLSIETSNVELDAAYVVDPPDATSGPHVMLAMSDTGVGMDDGVREHLFEPFYTTKAAGQGTGLGLATVYGIVKQSGGSIVVYSEPALGTAFKIFLPRADRVSEVADVHPQPPETILSGNEVVLIVEDQREVRSVTRETLTRCGYEVVEAANGQEALRVAAEHVGPIHLLLTDLVMPGMRGTDLAARLRLERRDVRVLYMSGYTSRDVDHRVLVAPGAAFIEKPFSPDALRRKVREVIDDT